MNFDDDFEMDDSPNEYLTAIGASGDKKRNSRLGTSIEDMDAVILGLPPTSVPTTGSRSLFAGSNKLSQTALDSSAVTPKRLPNIEKINAMDNQAQSHSKPNVNNSSYTVLSNTGSSGGIDVSAAAPIISTENSSSLSSSTLMASLGGRQARPFTGSTTISAQSRLNSVRNKNSNFNDDNSGDDDDLLAALGLTDSNSANQVLIRTDNDYNNNLPTKNITSTPDTLKNDSQADINGPNTTTNTTNNLISQSSSTTIAEKPPSNTALPSFLANLGGKPLVRKREGLRETLSRQPTSTASLAPSIESSIAASSVLGNISSTAAATISSSPLKNAVELTGDIKSFLPSINKPAVDGENSDKGNDKAADKQESQHILPPIIKNSDNNSTINRAASAKASEQITPKLPLLTITDVAAATAKENITKVDGNLISDINSSFQDQFAQIQALLTTLLNNQQTHADSHNSFTTDLFAQALVSQLRESFEKPFSQLHDLLNSISTALPEKHSQQMQSLSVQLIKHLADLQTSLQDSIQVTWPRLVPELQQSVNQLLGASQSVNEERLRLDEERSRFNQIMTEERQLLVQQQLRFDKDKQDWFALTARETAAIEKERQMNAEQLQHLQQERQQASHGFEVDKKRWVEERDKIQQELQQLRADYQTIERKMLDKRLEQERLQADIYRLQADKERFTELQRTLDRQETDIKRLYHESCAAKSQASQDLASAMEVRRENAAILRQLDEESKRIRDERGRLEALRQHVSVELKAQLDRKQLEQHLSKLLSFSTLPVSDESRQKSGYGGSKKQNQTVNTADMMDRIKQMVHHDIGDIVSRVQRQRDLTEQISQVNRVLVGKDPHIDQQLTYLDSLGFRK